MKCDACRDEATHFEVGHVPEGLDGLLFCKWCNDCFECDSHGEIIYTPVSKDEYIAAKVMQS